MPLTQVDQGLLSSTAQYTGFKNRIINGAMVIDQRNAGGNSTAIGYTVDRWGYFGTQSNKGTWGQNFNSVTPPAGFKNYLGFQTGGSAYSVLSGDLFEFYQPIEGYNVADLGFGASGASTVTLSFWVRSSLTGTFGGGLTNSGNTRNYPFTYTINSANTWEQKTVTVTGDTTGTWLTTNGSGLIVIFGLGAGSSYSGTANAWNGTTSAILPTGATSVVGTANATFYITGVQLEKGSTATSFDYRPYGTELALCQRYFQTDYVFHQGTFGYFMAYYGGTNAISPLQQIMVPMRTSPTMTFTNSTVEYYSYSGVWTSTTLNGGGYNNSTIFIYTASDGDGRGKLFRTGSGGTAGAPYYLLSAEL